MKKTHRFFLTGSLLLAASILPASATIFWDGTDITADADGGNGTWDTTTANWASLATGGTNTVWTSTEFAVFGGTAGTVSIATGGITAAGVEFSTTGYTLTGAPLNVGAGSITTDAGVSASIAAPIAGTSGLTKAGSGTLTVNAVDTYTGTTSIAAGTLKNGVISTTGYRYYRFVVNVNTGGDGYNQIGELHFYKNGAWVPAPNGASSANGASGSEQFWGNANDNKGSSAAGFTKFGFGTRPYSITYDYGSPIVMDSYNWSTANDSTPSRNPRRWQVLGSNDNTNFVVIDDRTGVDQIGPTATYTWSSPNGVFVAADNGTTTGGLANAFPLAAAPGSLPSAAPLTIATGGTFDLGGLNYTTPSLTDSGAGATGSIVNSVAALPATLVDGTNSADTFSGTISGPVSLATTGTGSLTLAGSASNTYTGTTVLGGSGKIVAAKTGGAIAIPGNVLLASTAFGGDAAGLVLGGNEEIADTAVITWQSSGYGLSSTNTTPGQTDTFFRLHGFTETIGGLVTQSTSTVPVVENRGNNDLTTYGNSTLILNVTGTNLFTYTGQIRDADASSNSLGGKVSLTKTGTGTQVLAGPMGSATGQALVNAGTLRINNTLGSANVAVIGSGTVEGTGTLIGLVTVQAGGTLSPGVANAGTLTTTNPVSIAAGGTLKLAGTATLAGGGATIASGGTLTGVGTISSPVSVQTGGELLPGGTAIGTLTTSNAVTLAGDVTMQINKAGSVFTNDKVSGFSKLTLGGTLTIVAAGDAPVLGDVYQLFVPGSGGSISGAFSSISGLPALAAGLQWETTTLASTGKITVVNTTSTPVFTPNGGGYVGGQTVSIVSDPGATIYYTTDGSTPTTSSPSGVGSVTGITVPVGSSVTVKAYATSGGFNDSAVVTSVYNTVALPKWNVNAGGNWSLATNWLNSVVANGADTPADFSFPITASQTVTLDTTRTIGSLSFTNVNPAALWTLGGTSTLTLSKPSGTPTIETVTPAVITTITTPLAGSQGYTKIGAGILKTTGTSTYTGPTSITGGTLSIGAFVANGSSSQIGSGSIVNIDNGATLQYTGGSINGPFNRNIVLGANGGTLDYPTAGNFLFSYGVISGSGALSKTGPGQLIVQASNTYTGITSISDGELQIRTTDALGATSGKTVVNTTGRLAVGQNLGATALATINEPVDLNGYGGTPIATSTTGALTCNDGGVNALWAGPINLATDSGIGGNFASPSIFNISGAISGPGALAKLGSSSISLLGTSSNTYVGDTTLGGTGRLVLAKTGGAIAIPGNINMSSLTAPVLNLSGLVLAGDEQIADSSVITFTTTALGSATQQDSYFRLNGHTETIRGLVSTGNGGKANVENRGNNDTTAFGPANLILNTAGGSFSYNGTIRDMDGGTGGGSIALTKTGTGTQILAGNTSYTGATLVNGGTLELDSLINASPITVATTGTLKGAGVTVGTVTVNAGGAIAPGSAAAGVGVFAAGNTVIKGSYACDVDGATADRLNVAGSLDITGASLDFTTVNAPTADSYILATYTTTLTGTFTVTGLPTGYAVVYDATNLQIRLDKSTATGFAAYASAHGLNGSPTADFDGDGLSDALEYVLGTSPTTSNGSATSATVSGGNLVFTFNRDHASMTSDISVAVQVSSDLVNWPTSYHVGADTASSDAGITVTNNGTSDTITLTVAQAPDAKKFARVNVTVTP